MFDQWIELENITENKDLGVIFTENLCFNKHAKCMIAIQCFT